MTRAVRAVALAAALLAPLLAPLRPATGGTDPTSAAPVPGDAIELISQDPWTPVGGELRLGVHLARAVAEAPDASVRVVASQALRSRADFDRVIVEGPSGPSLDEVELPVAGLVPDADGARAVVLGLESPERRDASLLALRRPGVYPLTVETHVDGQDALSGLSFTTFAVVTEATPDGQPQEIAGKLGVALVWPLEEGPSLLPDGTRDPDVLRSFGTRGRLGLQAGALARAGDVRLTLVPRPETLEAWIARGRSDPAAAQGAAAVLDAAGRAEVLPSTYIPTDIASLLGAGLDTLVDTQLVHGRDVLETVLGSEPDPSVVLARGPDDATLERLRAAGATHVVVDRSALAPESSDPTTLVQPFELRAGDGSGGSLQAIASDSGLVSLLGGDGAPALRAQRLLAGLSIVALEAPSATRAVALTLQPELRAPSALFDELLAGLRGNPWLESMTVSDAFARVPAASGRNESTRSLAPSPVPAPPVPADAYRLTRLRVDAFSAVVGADDPIVVEANQSMLVVESATFVGPEGIARASATLDHVNNRIDGFLAGIRVPDPGTITLTSRSGEIPLTFRNDTGRRVRVTVTLQAPKLLFPDGPTVTLDLAPRSTTLPVAVEARTSGTFPVRLGVRTAAGGLVVAETQLQVRSTVVSTVGLSLMIGAAVFLALWWGLYIRRARRRRRSEHARG